MKPPDLPDASWIEGAVAAGRARRAEDEGIRYVHLTKDVEGMARGTVLLPDRLVPSYPRIAHVLRLRAGLRRHLPGEWVAEEKVDGFNVRLLRAGDRLVAFTRSGRVCPFATDRAPEFVPARFFERHPDAVLCLEVAGPDNPYNESSPPFVREDVGFFAFDVIDPAGGFVPPREKWRLFEEEDVPTVRLLGWGRADLHPEGILEVARRLHDEGREGIVFKAADESRRVKYVTPAANLLDISIGSEYLEELPPHYTMNRLTRLLLGLDELGIEPDALLERRLGGALVRGFFDALERLRAERRIYHTYRCRFRTRERAERLIEQLRHASAHIKVRARSLERRGDHWLLEFDKIFLRSTSVLRSLFEGRAMFD